MKLRTFISDRSSVVSESYASVPVLPQRSGNEHRSRPFQKKNRRRRGEKKTEVYLLSCLLPEISTFAPGRNRTNESANVIGMKGSTPVDTHANAMNGNAMDVDLGPAPSESPNDPPPPNEPANAASISSSAVSLYTGPGPTPSASSSDPSVATPPTQSANTHSSSAQNPSAPSTSTASPALTYDSFWSSVSSVSTSTQRPNLAALTTHVAGKNTSSGTVAGYQSYQNLQSFQALQAFRAALSGNGAGEGTAGLQAGQNESQKAGAAAHVDENSSSATPEGAGTAQH